VCARAWVSSVLSSEATTCTCKARPSPGEKKIYDNLPLSYSALNEYYPIEKFIVKIFLCALQNDFAETVHQSNQHSVHVSLKFPVERIQMCLLVSVKIKYCPGCKKSHAGI
jgi:hypothetical protein